MSSCAVSLPSIVPVVLPNDACIFAKLIPQTSGLKEVRAVGDSPEPNGLLPIFPQVALHFECIADEVCDGIVVFSGVHVCASSPDGMSISSF